VIEEKREKREAKNEKREEKGYTISE